MAGLLRLAGVICASFLAFVLFVAIIQRTTGDSELAGWVGLVLGLLVTPAVLLHVWKSPDPGRKCPEGHGLYPECLIIVSTVDDSIEVKHPDGRIERIPFADLGEVRIETNDAGPWAADVWWMLLDKSARVAASFPGGATGESTAVTRLQELPGFDDQMLIQAMASTSVARFSCWKADGQPGTLSS